MQAANLGPDTLGDPLSTARSDKSFQIRPQKKDRVQSPGGWLVLAVVWELGLVFRGLRAPQKLMELPNNWGFPGLHLPREAGMRGIV